ncbi:MAG: hypothetical protein RBS73_14080 [Prolixibacteraceae bacterium]|jgi:hypothetical protein|nr:hypothetical protein [Prolixibacteraceae bacterium]
MSQTKKLLLLLVPSLYILLGIYIHQMIGLYSLRSADPEYIYFISGLSVACGKLELGHIDNPGTPLQYLAALVFRLVYLFRSHQAPFMEDVLSKPDMYLRILNLVLTVVVATFMYFAGKAASRISGKLSYGMVLQTAPFFTAIIFGNIGRITPENLLPLPAMLLSLLILKFIYSDESLSNPRNAVLFGLVSAFGLSIKLTYFPLWIIPLIVLSGWKNKLWYSFSAIISFFVMALPVTLRFHVFRHWVKSLLMHSGQYGKGESNIIDWSTVVPNFSQLTGENRIFFLVFIVMVILFLIWFFLKRNERVKLLQRISGALSLAVLIQIALVCKHFEQRYFIPSLMLAPMLLIIILEFSKRWHFQWGKYNLSYVALLLFFLFYAAKRQPVIESLSSYLDREYEHKMPAWHFMQNIEKDAIKILVPGFYGCPMPEYALMSSYGWAGKQKKLFKPVLGKLYPHTFIYYFWDKTVNFWADGPQLKETDKPVYIYMEHYKHREVFEEDMKSYFPENYKLEQVFFNEPTNEVVFKLIRQAADLAP